MPIKLRAAPKCYLAAKLVFMSQSAKLGKEGEAMALEHLRKAGYTILETNWRFGRDEIDIIARKADWLVIVEVKTRATDFFGDPQAFVTNAQQKRIIRAADAYIKEHAIDLETRFDCIGIVLNQYQKLFRHIEHAFVPGV